ncbi:hypothetical protein KEJ27_09565 [Candidatus Bathyarchaeota archaeon]|nr:hypothetical protein [Candidatus Bathyarchaeota archaeon]MBS7617539.1 hypothetical protein [Candidatus Bathyarchaeota archaeon]
MSLTLKKGLIVTPRGVLKGNLVVENRYITEIDGSAEPKGEVFNCDGCYVVPGFREQHMHDVNGLTKFLTDPDRIGKVSRALVAQGVTAFHLATVAMPFEDILTYLETCKIYMESGENGVEGARFEGAYVEGTFINAECAGAQPREYIILPNSPGAKGMVDSLLRTEVVKFMNIVPDFGVDLIEHVASKGVIVGCGHTKASSKKLAEAFNLGLKFIVHITNGAMGQSFKPFNGGGAYEAALTLPVYVEIIVDGYHVDFRYVSDIIERRICKNRSHEVIAITDSAFPVKEEVPTGEFRLFSTICCKHPIEDVLVVKGYSDGGEVKPAPPNTLCSSLLTMKKAFQNLLNMFTISHSGFMIDVDSRSLNESIQLVSMFTASNQARLEGLEDRGFIERGKVADLTVLRIEGEPGRFNVEIEATVVGGVVFERGL